jgi:hypothetical protein
MTNQPHSTRSFTRALATSVIASGLLAASTFAGPQVADKKTVIPEEPYEAGRGLITLQGPSGMFINPTSATLPKGAFTAQYCNFYPKDSGAVVGHGWMASYGVTDWLEIGGLANLVDVNDPIDRELGVGGPLVRIRLLRDKEWWPQFSIGAYAKWGTHALNQVTTFAAAYKRFPISESGFVKSIGIHAGVRGSWFDDEAAKANSVNGYWGAEVQFPYRVYLVGEIGTEGNTPGGKDKRLPYAFGAQWRLGGVNLTFAGIQSGTQTSIGYYWGVGFAHHF